MRRLLAAAVLVAFMPTAHAQDKGKADFSTNAEYRARYFWMQNPTMYEKGQSTESFAMGRFKVGLGYKASEKVSANLTLIHNANFGIDDNTTDAGETDENNLDVNEAYGAWMSSDDLNFKVGRMNYHIADGSFIGRNDWEMLPYAFEGLQANWEQEWGKLQFVAFKIRNMDTTAVHPAAGSSASADPEHNLYGVNFDLKTMPEWLKAFNAHIFKHNADAIVAPPGGTGTTVRDTVHGLDVMRYGVMASFAFNAFDLKANWEKQGGEMKSIAAGGTKTTLDYEGDMMQVEAGFSMPAMMASRFHLLYHKDSGDNDANAVTPDNSLKTYDPYFYEQHENAGLMDLIGWGNLTQIAVGWAGKPSDSTSVGVTYNRFKRTEASATSETYMAGALNFGTPSAANNKDELGDELDLWASHSYGNGLQTTALVGYFMPGDYFSDVSNNAPGTSDHRDDKVLLLMLEGKMTF